MIGGVRDSLSIVNRKEKFRMIFLFFINTISSTFEAASVGSVFVFLKVAMSPGSLGSIESVRTIYDYFGFEDVQKFLIIGSGLIFLIFLTRVCLQFLSAWMAIDLKNIIHVRVSSVIFDGYMNGKYNDIVSTSYSSIVNNISANIGSVVAHRSLGIVEIFSACTLAVTFIATLFLVKPLETMIVLIFLVVAVGIYWQIIHGKLSEWGERFLKANATMYGVVAEVSQSLKTIIVFRKQSFFAKKFKDAVTEQNDVLVRTTMMNHVPRLSFEIIIIGSVCLVMAVAFSLGESLVELVPTVALFGVAALRMLPAVMRIITSVQQYKQSERAADIICPLYSKFYKVEVRHSELGLREPQKCSLSGFQTIELQNVSFNYADANKSAVNGVSLRVDAGEMLGLAGYSGSGKSTTVDILLGLLPPTSGLILVDGVQLDSERLKCSGLFGYVPQDPIVLDDTLRANVAFGVDPASVDDDRVMEAIELAALTDVVEGLEFGLDSSLGGIGGSLSGGERQRLGIARALYHDAPGLVLDEPTSALDAKTESHISSALANLKGKKTIIVIAHRLSSLSACDNIAVFDKGRVVQYGTYNTLQNEHGRFAEMIELLNVTPSRGNRLRNQN